MQKHDELRTILIESGAPEWGDDILDRISKLFGYPDTNEGAKIQAKLNYLRGELREERISTGELAELQELAEYINDDDVELLEAAGVPEGTR